MLITDNRRRGGMRVVASTVQGIETNHVGWQTLNLLMRIGLAEPANLGTVLFWVCLFC